MSEYSDVDTTLSQAESNLLNEIMSEVDDDERVHHSHVERSLSQIRQQINVVNTEMAKMTVSMLEILTRLDHWLKERFKVWLAQMRKYQIDTATRFITTTALILAELKKVSTSIVALTSNSERIDCIDTKINQLEITNQMRDDRIRELINDKMERIEGKQDAILIAISSLHTRLNDVETGRNSELKVLNGVETEIRTLLAREDLAALLSQTEADKSDEDVHEEH